MSLSNVRKTIYNPLLQTKEEVTEYLKSLQDGNGTAHPFENVLLVRDMDKVLEIDISDKAESFFFSATDLNTLSETIQERIKLFPHDLADIKDYSVISLTGSYLEVPLVNDQVTIFALSRREPTYYDLCLGNTDGDLLCFSSTSHARFKGIKHSGDNSAGNNSLLQYVTFSNAMQNEPFALFVSGYQYNALNKYLAQNPAVMICDHSAKLMYVVPVPLDEVTIGDATLCIPVVGRRVGDKLCFGVLPAAVTSMQMATGKKLPNEAFVRAMAREVLPPQPSLKPAVKSESISKPNTKKAKLEVVDEKDTFSRDVDIERPLFVTEEGCDFPQFAKAQDGNHISYFQGISVHDAAPETVSNDDKTVVLPSVLGHPLEGSLILAVGKPFKGAKVSYEQYKNLFDKAQIILFTVSDRMTDQARVLNPDLRCNAIFIVQRHKPTNAQGQDTSVDDMLNDVKINAITALAGPQSIVVVQLGERYYFYRGIRWAGVFENNPKFGEDVTESIESIFGAVERKKNPWSNIMSISKDAQVYFRGTLCSADELYTNFTSLKMEELELFKPDILDTLAQLQVTMSPKDLPAFTSKLQNSLKIMMDNSFAPLKKEYVDKLIASGGKDRDARLFERYRKAEKLAKVQVQWLIDALGALVSSRISSTRKYDLKQMIRKQKIADNINASKDMTYEGLGELLEEHCTEVGMVIANIDSDFYQDLILEVSKGNVLPYLQQKVITDRQVCTLDDRVLYLSGLDSGIILPLSQQHHDGPLAGQQGSVAIALPRGISNTGDLGSAFAFACFDQFINIKHPFSQFWVELTNLHHVSMFRILQRSTMSSAIKSRELNIPASSKDLGFLIAYSLTDVMKSLAKTRTELPPEGDDSTTTKLMRGLFGYLMTLLASGTQPMSMAWQMLSKTDSIEIPTADTYWLYARIVELFPYTAWSIVQFRKNVQIIVARLIRKRITDPLTKPIQDNMDQIKQDSLKEFFKNRNKQLRWEEVVLCVWSRLMSGTYVDTEKVKGIAQRVISVVPDDQISMKKGSRGFFRVMRAFKMLANSGDLGKIDNDTKICAANTFAKRSASLKETKLKVIETSLEDLKKGKVALVELQTARKEMAASFGVETVHMQNEARLKDFTDAIMKGDKLERTDVKKLKSDGELTRIPWSVSESEVEPSKQHLVHYILTEEMLVSGNNSSGEQTVAVQSDNSLEKRLAALPRGDKASKMVTVIEKVESTTEFCKLAKLPQRDFEILAGFATGSDQYLAKMKLSVITYLKGWNDSVAAEKEVVQLLAKSQT